MNLDQFMAYCEAKDYVTKDFPFGPETMVYRVKDKIFALTGLDREDFKVNLKCDPAKIEELRDRYEDIKPGYHMNKKHWNTVAFESQLSRKLLYELIDESYNLVKNSLPKKDQF